MDFEYASIEDVLFEFGFFDEKVIVFEEVLDHREMIKGLYLKWYRFFSMLFFISCVSWL